MLPRSEAFRSARVDGTDASELDVSRVNVCLAVSGRQGYFRAAREAVRSVLAHSDFDVFVGIGSGPATVLPRSERVRCEPLTPLATCAERSAPFLQKFAALSAALRWSTAELFVLMDVDALFVATVRDNDIDAALGAGALGMVEQTGITGSSMARRDFLRHYCDHTLAWFRDEQGAPTLADFRYYNSGVVLGRRHELERLTQWATTQVRAADRAHLVGPHLIADQDYLQYWAHTLSPANITCLPWRWNHCQHWDKGFPRRDALVLHFSNFCNGPRRSLPYRMRWTNWQSRRSWWQQHPI